MTFNKLFLFIKICFYSVCIFHQSSWQEQTKKRQVKLSAASFPLLSFKVFTVNGKALTHWLWVIIIQHLATGSSVTKLAVTFQTAILYFRKKYILSEFHICMQGNMTVSTWFPSTLQRSSPMLPLSTNSMSLPYPSLFNHPISAAHMCMDMGLSTVIRSSSLWPYPQRMSLLYSEAIQ